MPLLSAEYTIHVRVGTDHLRVSKMEKLGNMQDIRMAV